MPSVMAIMSKAIFEKVAPRDVALGSVLAVDRYLSKNPAFDGLGPDDAIFVVTVRPPDERLWLVAILERPHADGDVWIGAPNTTPLSDVSALVPAFVFASGKGLKPAPGALGMSLQTPRVLAPADVERLRAAATPAAASGPAIGDARTTEAITRQALAAQAQRHTAPPSPAEVEAAAVGRHAWRGTEHDVDCEPVYAVTYTLDIASLAPGSTISGSVVKVPLSPELDEDDEDGEDGEDGGGEGLEERNTIVGVVAHSREGDIELRLRNIDAHDPARRRLEAGYVMALRLHRHRGRWRLAGDARVYPRDTPSLLELMALGPARIDALDDHDLALPFSVVLGRDHVVSKREHIAAMGGDEEARPAEAVAPIAPPASASGPRWHIDADGNLVIQPLAPAPGLSAPSFKLYPVTPSDHRPRAPAPAPRTIRWAQLADVLAPVRDKAYVYWSNAEKTAILERLDALGGHARIDYADILEREQNRALERPLAKLLREHARG